MGNKMSRINMFILESDNYDILKTYCKIILTEDIFKNIFSYYALSDKMFFVTSTEYSFYCYDEKATLTPTKLPFPLETEAQLVEFIKGMLNNIKYPLEPNTDGSYKAGFRLEYNYVGKLLIKPVWIVYSK